MEDRFKITVLIRVYDRIEDLGYNLKIISDTWTHNDYHVIVVSNGKSKGYNIDESLNKYIDKLIILETNAGHIKGNAQLLMEGIKHIPEDSGYILILEADTWLYGDAVISKYANILEQSDSVWASADWYDKYFSLAVDFALVKSAFLRENPKLLDIGDPPECYVAEYLMNKSESYISIKENMPVHVPSYVAKYPYVNDSKNRRFYIFPKSRMVTHHIEFLERGMAQKKEYFNIIAQCNYFGEAPVKNKSWKLFKIKFWIGLTNLMLRRSWYSKKMIQGVELKQ